MRKLYLWEKIKIRLQPRYTEFTTRCLGFPLKVVDKSSFLYMYQEIMEHEIYDFKPINEKRVSIIDAGANIGLATIFFKTRYPQSHVIAFEPDPTIFEVLKCNIASGNFKDVTLIQQGLSKKADHYFFSSDKSDGGRISSRKESTLLIKTTVLSKYLNQPIDFLKIDIEGHEVEVLEECSHLLSNVRNLFVEYHSFIDTDQKLDSLLSILHKNGFRYYIQGVPEVFKPFCVKRSYNGMDLQLNIYAYRP